MATDWRGGERRGRGPLHPVHGAQAGLRRLGRAQSRDQALLALPLRLVLQVAHAPGAASCVPRPHSNVSLS